MLVRTYDISEDPPTRMRSKRMYHTKCAISARHERSALHFV